MFYSSPQLSLGALLSVVRSARWTDPQDALCWGRRCDGAVWMSRSAWLLKSIVLWWEKVCGRECPHFWVPDYFCNQSLAEVRETSARLTFYPIEETLRPDWQWCERRARAHPPDIFILVHYFGDASDSKEAKRFCRRTGALMVEDAVHVLAPIPGVGQSGHLVLYSPHKIVAVPDGAVCIIRPQVERWKEGLSHKHAVRQFRLIVDGIGGASRASAWRWLARRLLQRMVPASLVRRLDHKKPHPFESDPPAAPLARTPTMSCLSRRMLPFMVSDVRGITQSRKEALATWQVLLAPLGQLSPLAFQTGRDRSPPPYLAVFTAPTAAGARKTYDLLRRRGFPVGTWPDLPPEVTGCPAGHPTAISLRRRLVTLPVHQSLSPRRLTLRYDGGGNATGRPEANTGRMEVTPVSRGRYEALLSDAEFPNLLQTGWYGAARHQTSLWRRVSSFILCQGGKPTAAFQALTLPLPMGGGLVRINRGPVWLSGSRGRKQSMAAIAAMRRYFRRSRGWIVMLAPELEDTMSNRMLLWKAGCRRIGGDAWHSGLLDIRPPEGTLRKGLKAKWRNQLRCAENAGLEFQCPQDRSAFEWVMATYSESMRSRGFKGLSVQLLRVLRRTSDRHHQLIVMQALSRRRITAAIVVARHGCGATYLVAWNGPLGRRLNANNFLLWNAIRYLKSTGSLWFDIGGIDEQRTASIAKFKRGLNASEYRLVGEWLA